jgi:hypothetical protein
MNNNNNKMFAQARKSHLQMNKNNTFIKSLYEGSDNCLKIFKDKRKTNDLNYVIFRSSYISDIERCIDFMTSLSKHFFKILSCYINIKNIKESPSQSKHSLHHISENQKEASKSVSFVKKNFRFYIEYYNQIYIAYLLVVINNQNPEDFQFDIFKKCFLMLKQEVEDIFNEKITELPIRLKNEFQSNKRYVLYISPTEFETLIDQKNSKKNDYSNNYPRVFEYMSTSSEDSSSNNNKRREKKGNFFSSTADHDLSNFCMEDD